MEVNTVEVGMPPRNWLKVCTLVPALVTVLSVRPPLLEEYPVVTVVVVSPIVVTRRVSRPIM